MMIEVLKSKIHCARVTEANLNYMGSITIDEDLLDARIFSDNPYIGANAVMHVGKVYQCGAECLADGLLA